MIRLVSISKHFPADALRRSDAPVRALREVSLEVSAGEYTTVVGPSGAGKSTLLRLIAGFEAPDHGEVWLDGKLMTGVPPAARALAMVLQEHPLFPQLNVEQNVGFPLRRLKMSATEARARIDDALATVGAEAWHSRAVTHLSGGERQRIALAMALVRRPRLLLLDEPLAQLDAPSRVALRRELRTLQRRQRLTVVHVTHDQSEAVTLGDRMVMLAEGAVRQVAPPTEILREPADLIVARFFGGRGYQTFSGQLTGPVGARVWVDESGWTWKVPPAWEPRRRSGNGTRAQEFDGLPVVLGLPSASLELVGAEAATEHALGRGRVESRDWSPEGEWIELRLGNGPRLVVRCSARDPVPELGAEVSVVAAVADASVHWFAGGDGRRLA